MIFEEKNKIPIEVLDNSYIFLYVIGTKYFHLIRYFFYTQKTFLQIV